jgi:hypothetical protein
MNEKLKSFLTAAFSHFQAFLGKSYSGKIVLAVGLAGLVIGGFLF